MEETIQKDQLSIRRAETEDTQYGTISEVYGAYQKGQAETSLMPPWFSKALMAGEGEPVVEVDVPHRQQPFYVFIDEHIIQYLISQNGIAKNLDDFVGSQVEFDVESGRTISIHGKEYVAYKKEDLEFTNGHISVDEKIGDIIYQQISDEHNRIRGTIKNTRSDGDRLYFVVELSEIEETLVFNLEMSLFYDENAPAYKFVEEYGNGAVENLVDEEIYLQRIGVDSNDVERIITQDEWAIVSSDEPEEESRVVPAVGIAVYLSLAVFASFAAVSASIGQLFFTAMLATMVSYYFFFKTLSQVEDFRKA